MSIQDPLLIAVDGGGTGCRVAVGTLNAGVLAQAKGGPANINTSFDGSVANIVKAVETALAQAGLDGADLAQATAHVGLAGADTAAARDRTCAALPFGRCIVTGDRETSVAGVLGRQDGFVIALGTGTIIARQQSGEIRTVGGWGFAISDQASGAWLGRALLTRALLVADRIEPATPLSQHISDQLGGLAGIVAFSATAQPGDYAKFAPEVFAAAGKGDKLALDLLHEGSAFLERGLDTLGYVSKDVLSLAGGVGPHYAPYLSEKYTRTVQKPKGNALEGAFGLAVQAAST